MNEPVTSPASSTDAANQLSALSRLLSAPPKPSAAPNFWHSDDYAEIRIGKVVHFLTRTQAAVFKYIHLQHLQGRVDVPGDRALREAGSECTRMGEVFRYSTAWQTVLISPFRRGYYSLSPFVSLK